MPYPHLKKYNFRHFNDHIFVKGLESFGEGFRFKNRIAQIGLCQEINCLSIQSVSIRQYGCMNDIFIIFRICVAFGVYDEH